MAPQGSAVQADVNAGFCVQWMNTLLGYFREVGKARVNNGFRFPVSNFGNSEQFIVEI